MQDKGVPLKQFNYSNDDLGYDNGTDVHGASHNDSDFRDARKALVSGLEKLISENWGDYCSNSTFQGMINAYRETLPAYDQGVLFEVRDDNESQRTLVQSWLQNLAQNGAYLSQDELQFLAAANGINLTVFNGTFAADGAGFLSEPQASSANIQGLVNISGCPIAKVLMHNFDPIPSGSYLLAGNHFSVMREALPSFVSSFRIPPPIPEGYTPYVIGEQPIYLPNPPTSNQFFVFCKDSNGVLQRVFFSLKENLTYSKSSRDTSSIDTASFEFMYDESGWSYKELGEFINLDGSSTV